MKSAWIIRQGRVVDPVTGSDGVHDLLVADGRIQAVDPSSTAAAGARELLADRCMVVPGFVDLHVHLREPGDEASETVATGRAAAARAGVTTLVAMPNTQPPLDTPDRLREVERLARQGFGSRVLVAACITRGREGSELADLEALAAAGAVAFTDDGSTVADDALMREAMVRARALDRPIMDHALDPALAAGGAMAEGARAQELGLPGIPAAAERAIIERDIVLCRETGCRLHIQHVSTRDGVARVAAAIAEGLPVSAEVTPHHLALTDADVSANNTAFKMSPPLGNIDDREALRSGLEAGTLSVIATDHAPHGPHRKDLPFVDAAFGAIGLESAIPVTYTLLVESGALHLLEWVRRWTTGPARVLGLPPPSLTEGAPADLCIFDPRKRWTIRADRFISRSRNTPFEGLSVVGDVTHTFLGGRQIWPAVLY